MKKTLLLILIIFAGAISLVFGQPMSSSTRRFLLLYDTPKTYTDQADKILQVNADENAIEFTSLSGLIALGSHTSGNYIETIADAGNSAITVTGSGTEGGDVTLDITDSGITEADLKAVDSATDEDILTYESTTGDFEWHTIVQMLALTDTDSLSEGSTNLYQDSEVTGWIDDVTLGSSGALTLPTGQNFVIGTTTWNSGDTIDGEQIKDDTIDDDSIDWSDCTLADFDYETNWKMWHSDGSGDVTEITLGADGTFLESNGASAAPAFRALADADVPDDITIDLAALATTLTITDNEDTAENNPIVFVAGGDLDGGDLGLETDGDAHYNPSTGTITATEFAGGGSGLTGIDGEQITNDTIDNDSIDWGDMTDLTTDGAVVWGNIAEGELTNSTVVSADIKDGEVALADLAAAAYAKDLVTGSPITGGVDNVFVGEDSDVTLNLDFTASWDFGVAAGLEIPHGAAPTTNETGEIALDTTITDHQPLVQYYDGGENMTVIAVDTAQLPAEDNEIVKYDAASDKFVLEADESGATTAWDDIGDPDAAGTVDFTTHTQTIDIGKSDIGGGSGLILDVTGLGAGNDDVIALEITTDTNIDSDYIPIAIFDDSEDLNSLLFKIDYKGYIHLKNSGEIQNSGEKLIFKDNSDNITMDFDGTDVNLLWSDGALNLRNEEDGVDAIVEIEGKDAGEKGILRVLSDGDDKHIEIYHDDTDGQITTNSGDLYLTATGGDINLGDDNLTTTGAISFGGASTSIPWKVNATAAPTVEGQAIWESDTDELTVGDGAASIVIAAKTNTVFCFNVHDIDDGMDDIKMPFTRATTITKVTAFVTGGTNVVGRLYEVDGDGDDADAVGVESSDWTFTAGETEDASFNNATFDAGDYIQWDTTSVSGSVTGFMISVEGYEI